MHILDRPQQRVIFTGGGQRTIMGWPWRYFQPRVPPPSRVAGAPLLRNAVWLVFTTQILFNSVCGRHLGVDLLHLGRTTWFRQTMALCWWCCVSALASPMPSSFLAIFADRDRRCATEDGWRECLATFPRRCPRYSGLAAGDRALWMFMFADVYMTAKIFSLSLTASAL